MPRDGLESRGQSGKSPGQRIQESSASGKSPQKLPQVCVPVCLSASLGTTEPRGEIHPQASPRRFHPPNRGRPGPRPAYPPSHFKFETTIDVPGLTFHSTYSRRVTSRFRCCWPQGRPARRLGARRRVSCGGCGGRGPHAAFSCDFSLFSLLEMSRVASQDMLRGSI